jgi:hypothetical protein
VNPRPLQPGDDRAIEELFAATIALGRPLGFACPGFDAYRDLCLGWYLGPGRDDAVVLEAAGRIVGYALACMDARAHRTWVRSEATTWVWRTSRAILGGHLPPEAERFYRLRMRDGWAGLVGPPPPCGPHLHLNVESGARGGRAGRLLIGAAEERFRQAGHGQWYGEINAPVGRRAAALERFGGRIVARRPSHTFSWLADRPVEQLRVTRSVPAEAQSQPLRRKARYSSPAAVAMPASTNGYPNRQPSSGKVSKFMP